MTRYFSSLISVDCKLFPHGKWLYARVSPNGLRLGDVYVHNSFCEFLSFRWLPRGDYDSHSLFTPLTRVFYLLHFIACCDPEFSFYITIFTAKVVAGLAWLTTACPSFFVAIKSRRWILQIWGLKVTISLFSMKIIVLVVGTFYSLILTNQLKIGRRGDC